MKDEKGGEGTTKSRPILNLGKSPFSSLVRWWKILNSGRPNMAGRLARGGKRDFQKFQEREKLVELSGPKKKKSYPAKGPCISWGFS